MKLHSDDIKTILDLDLNNEAGLKNVYLMQMRIGDVEKAMTERDYTMAAAPPVE